MKIAILGAGAWGTALAVHVAARHQTGLWSRNAAVIEAVRASRINQPYLPGVRLPEALGVTDSMPEAVAGADLVVLATSVAGLRPVARSLAGVAHLGPMSLGPMSSGNAPGDSGGDFAGKAGGAPEDKGGDLSVKAGYSPGDKGCDLTVNAGYSQEMRGDSTRNLLAGATGAGDRADLPGVVPAVLPTVPGVVCLAKGLEAGTGKLAHEVLAEELPGWRIGCLSGPSFAEEVAAGLPVALTAASGEASLPHEMVAAFHHGAMRVYRSSDLVGVEIAGALKNVMAVASGISDGMGLGLNARSALLTRGLAEITRFGLAHGAQAETFLGLAGVGDLVLTCTGDLSRNRRVGLALGQGKTLAEVLASLGHVAEGVACCPAVVAKATQLGVELPISRTVLAIIEGRLSAREGVAALLAREPRSE